MDDDGDDDDALLRSAIALVFCKLVEGGYRIPAVPYVYAARTRTCRPSS